jgi:5'-nucleotidase
MKKFIQTDLTHLVKTKSVLIIALLLLFFSCDDLSKQNYSHEFTLLGTADLQGLLEPSTKKKDVSGHSKSKSLASGGIARIATLIKKIKKENRTVIVLSTGDDLMNKYFHTYKGKAIFQLMSEAGYDIYAFGNHEFDKGPEILAKALENVKFQCICSDLKIDGTPLESKCRPYLIRRFNGLTIGFFSLMTEDFPFVTSGQSVTLNSGNIETARQMVKMLKDQGAQVIIALTHIGFPIDINVAKKVTGIHIIFGGHSHDYPHNLYKTGNTIIVNGGEKGTYLVRLDIKTDSAGGILPDETALKLIPVTHDIVPDPKIESFLDTFRKNFPNANVHGHTQVEWDMSKRTLRENESPVANLVNDLMLEKFHVDIVLNNAGAFRGQKKYGPGPVTDMMLKEIDEFSNYAYFLDIKGIFIKEILEHSAANFGEGGLLHAAGLRYTFDLKKTPQKIERNKKNQWQITTPGKRVLSILVRNNSGDWSPLDSEKTYRVLSNSFIVNQQGDGYFWFNRYGKNLRNTYSTFYSILVEFVETKKIINPKKPDNRLAIIY